MVQMENHQQEFGVGNSIDISNLGFNQRIADSDVEMEDEEEVPKHLNTLNSSGGFLVVSPDKLSVHCTNENKHGHDVGAIQANCPAPTRRLVYYFEMHVVDAGTKGQMSIGFTSENCMTRQPGWEANTYGYHGDDGMLYRGQGKGEIFGPTYTSGDTVGGGINYASQEIFFTKNGKLVGKVHKDVKGPLFPTVAVHSQNEKVNVNFEQKPFVFDIKGFASEERLKQHKSIGKISLPPDGSHGQNVSKRNSLNVDLEEDTTKKKRTKTSCSTEQLEVIQVNATFQDASAAEISDCLAALTEYLLTDNVKTFTDAVKHLLYAGWKVELTGEEEKPICCTSPNGIKFDSVNEVSEYLTNMASLREILKYSSSSASSESQALDHHENEDDPGAGDKLDENGHDEDPPGAGVESCGNESEDDPPRAGVESCGNETDDDPPSVDVEVNQVVKDWCRLASAAKPKFPRHLSKKVKEHLVAVGWSLQKKDKVVQKKVKQEWRYTSPTNHTFTSLVRACKEYLKDTAGSTSHQRNDGVSLVRASKELPKDTAGSSSSHPPNDEAEVKMDVDLTPKLSKKLYGGDGGSYFAWSPSDLLMLEKASIAASKLSLLKNGLSLPSYSDSAKVAYVLKGSGTAGIALHEAEKEKVISIKTGDAIALPFGVVTWWYNANDTELIVLFLGETSKAHKVGEFTNFALTGSNGIFSGFSTEFVGRACDLEEAKVKELIESQKDSGITKLPEDTSMPEPRKEDRDGMALNCLEAPLDVGVQNGGCIVVLNAKNLPLVGVVGLGADLVRLDKGAMCSPGFSCDSSFQVMYIIRGSGRCQVVGPDGKCVLETRVEAGNLFIVPRFFVVSQIADGEGLEWFSIISTPNPIFTNLAGKTSIWKALSPEVLAASFNVSKDVEKLFRSKRTTDAVFFPPPN